MKYLILIPFLAFISCAHNVNNKPINYKDVTYDTSKEQITVMYLVNTKPITPSFVPGKLVTYHHYNLVQDTTSGDTVRIIYIPKAALDTAYLISTLDSALVLSDSLNKPILDSNKKIQYKFSFRKPILLPSTTAQRITILRYSHVQDSFPKSK